MQTINKSQLFTTAHKIAKETREDFASYREAFSAALKAAWKQILQISNNEEIEETEAEAEAVEMKTQTTTINYITRAQLIDTDWYDKHYNELGEIRHPVLNRDCFQISIDNSWSIAEQVELINEAIAAARGEVLL